jgi:hypothetical protein
MPDPGFGHLSTPGEHLVPGIAWKRLASLLCKFCSAFIRPLCELIIMSLFEMTAGTRYGRIVFDADELVVLQAACAFVSSKEHDLMDKTANAGIEQYAVHLKKAGDSDMADVLVSLFKPGQEVLIEREDLEPVLECLRTYGESLPQEHAMAAKNVIEKIERCCRRD